MLDPTVRGPRRYNRPTADEVAAIIVQPENDDEPLDRDIIIQHQHTGELQRISQHSPCYIPMRYPLIIPHGKEGWHPLIPLADIHLADNVNLQARRRTHINSESEDDSDVPRHGREVLKEFHCLNIMLFNYTSVMVYSLLFFMHVDYVKNIVLMLGFALNPIVFNEYGQIKQS